MLKHFSVSGFKGFNTRFELDFSNIRDYRFNTACTKNGLAKNAVLYGKNSSGKTNFGLALFDVVTHMTSNNVTPKLYDYYINAANGNRTAKFEYTFVFDNSIIVYGYEKNERRQLLDEYLSFNDDLMHCKDMAKIAPTLNLSLIRDGDSVLKYVINNTILEETHPLRQMMSFINRMLWIGSLDEKRYIGYTSNVDAFSSFLTENEENLHEFELLLNTAGIPLTLSSRKDADGVKRLYTAPSYDKTALLPFFGTSSSGTIALYHYFYWKKTAPDISFLFIDDFDAYYHFELAEVFQKELQTLTSQVITTSHNTNLLTNRIMRPDCCFVINENGMFSFADASSRELREGHNLEKLYISGEFDV